MSYLGIFGLGFENAIFIFEINAPKYLKHEFLTDRVNFGIGSTFSKGLWSVAFLGSWSGFGSILQSMPK